MKLGLRLRLSLHPGLCLRLGLGLSLSLGLCLGLGLRRRLALCLSLATRVELMGLGQYFFLIQKQSVRSGMMWRGRAGNTIQACNACGVMW